MAPLTLDLLQKALTLHRRGAIAEAAAIYAEVQRADPHNADACYYLATIACQQGQFAEGKALARKALSNDPRHARAHVLLGRALAALGQKEEALASFDRALALAQDLVQAHSHRADVLAELARNVEAIEAYDRAIAAAPDAIEDWFNRGAALAAVGRHGDALSSFDRVIAARHAFAPAHLHRAKALSDLHRYDEALEAADRALAVDPKFAEGWLGRGHVLAALRRHQDALAAFDKSLELKPDLDQAWMGRGNVLVATGKHDLALAAAQRALELKETPQTKILFARALTLCGLAGAASTDQIHELVLRALLEAWIRPRDLVGVCIDLIKRNSVVSEAIARANAAWPKRLTAAGSAEVMGALHQDNAAYYGATPATGHLSDAWGWVVGGGIKINTPFISPGDYFITEANYTQGALKYLWDANPSDEQGVRGATEGFGIIADCVYGGTGATADRLPADNRLWLRYRLRALLDAAMAPVVGLQRHVGEVRQFGQCAAVRRRGSGYWFRLRGRCYCGPQQQLG